MMNLLKLKQVLAMSYIEYNLPNHIIYSITIYYMTNLNIFLENNIEYIIIVVILFISLLTLFTVLGVDFNSHRHDHIDKIVTVESFINEISEDSKVPSNEEEENESQDDETGADAGSNTGADAGDDEDGSQDLDNTGDLPLMDDSEETGNPIRVSFSKKQKAKEDHKKYKQRRIMELLKKKHDSIQSTIGDRKINSHCDPLSSTAESIESHCNTMNHNTNICKTHNCCVWLSNEASCVAGNKDGPTFLTKNGQYRDSSQYHYNGECYGKSCPSNNNK